jgi:hypothetical protein
MLSGMLHGHDHDFKREGSRIRGEREWNCTMDTHLGFVALEGERIPIAEYAFTRTV